MRFSVRVVLLLVATVMVSELHSSVCLPKATAKAENLISSSAGLDVSKVYFSLWTVHEFQDQLFEHAIARLAKAGLFPIHDRTYKQGEALLKVTIEASPVSGLPGKVMYRRSLELYENVFTERTPRIRAWAVTLSGGIPGPILVDQMNIDQLKTDLDGLLDDFILDYKYANQGKK